MGSRSTPKDYSEEMNDSVPHPGKAVSQPEFLGEGKGELSLERVKLQLRMSLLDMTSLERVKLQSKMSLLEMEDRETQERLKWERYRLKLERRLLELEKADIKSDTSKTDTKSDTSKTTYPGSNPTIDQYMVKIADPCTPEGQTVGAILQIKHLVTRKEYQFSRVGDCVEILSFDTWRYCQVKNLRNGREATLRWASFFDIETHEGCRHSTTNHIRNCCDVYGKAGSKWI